MRMSLCMVKEIQLSSYGLAKTDMNPFGDLDKFSFKSCKIKCCEHSGKKYHHNSFKYVTEVRKWQNQTELSPQIIGLKNSR